MRGAESGARDAKRSVATKINHDKKNGTLVRSAPFFEIKLVSRANAPARASLSALAAVYALVVVDDGKIVLHRDRALRTDARALAAGDAAHLAGIHDRLALRVRGAGDIYPGVGGDGENSFLGQASMHAPQEMHLSSVCAQPPGREMAPSGQTREQLPSPRHPYLQDLCPPASLFSSAQSFAPL